MHDEILGNNFHIAQYCWRVEIALRRFYCVVALVHVEVAAQFVEGGEDEQIDKRHAVAGFMPIKDDGFAAPRQVGVVIQQAEVGQIAES